MTLQEYYNFPEGIEPIMNGLPHWLEDKPNFPCPPDMSYAFAHSKIIKVPLIDVSNVTNMNYMFNNCSKLISLDGIENWDTSKVVNMSYIFYQCISLISVDYIKNWNVSNVTNMGSMFYYCKTLTSIDLSNWDTSKVTTMGSMFDGCSKLETLSSINCSGITGTDNSGAGMFGYSGISTLKNFGGWIGLKKSVNNYGINKCPNLTYESCINVLNGLFDFTGNGKTPASNEGKLKVHSNFLTLVGDEISIGTNKGWTITT